MISFSVDDVIRAILLLIFIEGLAYLFFPKAIQLFATRCLVDANFGTLRLFGAALICAGIFLLFLLGGSVE